MQSFLKGLQQPFDRGHIVIDFDIIEFPLEDRKTVVDKYGPWKFNRKFHKFVIVGLIKATNEDLIVPPEYGMCSFGLKFEPQTRPPIDHLNHPAIQELIDGSTSTKN